VPGCPKWDGQETAAHRRKRLVSVGRVVKGAGPVDPAEGNALGFLLGDKRAGPLKLAVEWIKVVRGGEGK
jgi:hypothetical protein